MIAVCFPGLIAARSLMVQPEARRIGHSEKGPQLDWEPTTVWPNGWAKYFELLILNLYA